ncbi:MAG: TetR/AcrR family transcriptional regulator [Chloroflexota bacterium]|nr:TetR/AcrR family transcriptional regulator [Chloroflexota bacterium]
MATNERRAREKARRRQEILQAAKVVFFENGFHKATVDDIATHAEVSKGTIYLYFESKESILAHLLLEGLALLLAQLNEVYAARQPLPAEERLWRLARAYLNFSQAHPNYFRLMVAFDRGRFREQIPPELYEKILRQSMHSLELVTQAVTQGIQEGSFTCDDPKLSAGILWAALNGVLVLMANPLRRQMLSAELEPMFEATMHLVMRGLRQANA